MPQPIRVPTIGSPMPDIPLIGPTGETSTLAAERGDGPAVVFFMRAATCPVCLGHARTILAMRESGELANARFILVAPGDAGEAATAASRLGSPAARSGDRPDFSVWASGEEHASVGLGTFLSIQHSGTFVLDADGRVRDVRTATIPVLSFSRAAVAAALR